VTELSRSIEHVEAFNQAVTSGDWETFAERFATDARMEFVGAPKPIRSRA
jgi:steroid Delta-isomerase